MTDSEKKPFPEEGLYVDHKAGRTLSVRRSDREYAKWYERRGCIRGRTNFDGIVEVS